MSTKTTFKRVALVAVAALGLGVLSSVAPASAAQGRQSAAITIGSASMKTGVYNYVPITVQMGSDWVMGDSVTVTAQITAAPTTGGNANAASVLGTGAAAASNGDGARFKFVSSAIGAAAGTPIATAGQADVTAVTAGNSTAGQLGGAAIIEDDNAGEVSAAAYNVITSSTNTTAAGSLTVWLAIKPDLSGSYSVLVATNSGLVPTYTAGDTRATATFATTGSVASIAVTALNTSPVGANPNGVLLKAVLKDSAGNPTNLGSLDTVTFTSSSTNDSFYQCDDSGCTTPISGGAATQGMFVNGVGYFKVSNAGTANAANTITATTDIVGGTNTSTTVTATFKAMIALGATAAANTLTQGLGSTTAGYTGTPSQSAAWTMTTSSTATSSAVKFTLPAAAAAAGYYYVTITDSSKSILGSDTKAALSWTKAVSIAAAATSVSVSTTHAALGNAASSYTVTTPTATTTVVGIGATAAVVTVNGATSVTTGTNVLTASPAGPIAAVAKGTVTLSANLTDRFGAAIASGAVTVSVAGRNTVAATSKLSDADGNVTFSYTDAGTITASDVVTFTYNNGVATANSTTVTVTFGGAAVSTVKLDTPNTTAGVANATVAVSPIYAGDGAENGAVAVTATVKDAAGNLLVGVPVTWTVSTGGSIPTAEVTSYSSTAGVASSHVYATKAGAYTVTATAGGIAGTGAITFGSTTAGNARVLSATVEGNVVTAKVVDRFGNPVKGVTVYAVKTGAGYFGAGLAKTSDTTLADGTASFGITGGNASVTVTTLDPTAAAGTNAAGQTCALAGNLTCASGATAAVAFTASVAGTSLVSETYAGASSAPAGVSSATVEVTDAASTNASAAADAAAEATDAANAATDAANAAAEAADAATAAAQDAADAVAALSAQVASLISGLKAQLTALTNLVIKIQKKVKA